MWYIKKRIEAKYNIIFRKDHTTTLAPIHFQAILGFFWISWPRVLPTKMATDLSVQSEKTNLPALTKGLSSNNQNPTIIQACNRRNHEAFQLTDIFPFTSQCPQDHTHVSSVIPST